MGLWQILINPFPMSTHEQGFLPLQGSERMGRKKKDDEEKNKSITISIQPSVLRRIDLVPGMQTRSWKINRLLNLHLPEEFDRSKLEYFLNAVAKQGESSELWSHLKKSAIEKYLRKEYKLSMKADVWSSIPGDVKSWFDAYVLPLKRILKRLNTDERLFFCDLAYKELEFLLSK